MSRPLPTPDELDDSPELSVLAVLDVTLEAARAALLSVHRELRTPDDFDEPGEPAALSTAAVAQRLIPLADALLHQVAAYHDALEHEKLRRHDEISRRDF